MGSLVGMKVQALDHVALWVDERDRLAGFLVEEFGMHVIERTDAFTLVGGDARRGKLTLFAAEGPRERGVLGEIAIRVPAKAPRPSESLVGPGDVPLRRIESDDEVADLDHVTFRVPAPEQARAELAELGFAAEDGDLRAGSARVELEPGEPEATERPLLNHLGLRVDSAEEHIREARRRGLPIADVVDGPNTLAVFVWGPDRIKLEYVEHKASFSLV
jgi:catechol 2,3-dioxygenase-like lactoylglutathione lyase family enzyme